MNKEKEEEDDDDDEPQQPETLEIFGSTTTVLQ